MRCKFLGIILVACGLFIGTSGFVTTNMAAAAATSPSPQVQELIDKFKLEIVDYDYAVKAIGDGTRNGAKAVLIDARPNPKYLRGTIPSSISIPDTQIDKYIGQLDGVAKDKEILVFCGGWGCEKSPIVAGHLQGLGYTNVKLYQAGEPEWGSKNYLEVGLPVVESALEKDSALLMDARPRPKYLGETIPGALYMNDVELDRLAGRFPADKNTAIIAFCGGYECHKSHVVANALLARGYKNVSVYAGGLPEWKKAGMRTTSGAKKASADTAVKEDVFVDGIKAGVDEGTVDGEWLNGLIQEGKVPANVTLIDVRKEADYNAGHLPGSINIEAGDLSSDDLVAKLPQDKVSIFFCGSGARAMEAFLKLKDDGKDVTRVMYFDANISCNSDNVCEIEVNEPLG
ncbi:MAG: rhodanese-like domain-containing protein [Desulfopila sp.]|jgi:rhodanese-related sulfurtransferase|nr:rhodanese-like domain-containing protein [Desulfopila sp.]